MDVYFLSADKPIVKRYEQTPAGELVKHPYPFVYEVTSIPTTVPNIAGLYPLLQKHAAQGHCLLKGLCHRPLQQESRAGSTNADDKTDWICLDLDGVEGFQDVDSFLAAIGAADVTHIVQWSSSQGIDTSTGFRCHVFLQLAQAYHPQLLKYWLMSLNLTIPQLAGQMTLTATQNSLRWPLDITTCQNDKLLYIAPPQFGKGLTDPFKNKPRISLETRKHATFKLTAAIPTREALREAADDRIEELRDQAGLPKKRKLKNKYKYAGAIEYMTNPDTATITEMKQERGFVYFNLNGGDSWAYYHPEDNPTFIFNFKGEPVYRTEDLLPDYWATVMQRVANYQPDNKGIIYLAFRDFPTSTYWNGTFDTGTEVLNIAMARSETQLRHFMKQHGQPMGDFIPDWHLVFDPHTAFVVDPVTHQVNTFQRSPAMSQHPLPIVRNVPPTIMKVIDHVLGNEPQTISHFINWLACIAQRMEPTQTAWILQGTQGTGKGMLFHQILTPLFGAANVSAKRMEELESEFTGFMENKFIVFIDEIEQGSSLYHSKITAKLKNLIAEPTISIRKMYSPPYMAKNYANMIFASNKSDPVYVAPDDRRFNVGPYQNQKLKITSTEVDNIANEVNAFAAYLLQYPADPNLARSPLNNQARETLINISMTAIDTISNAINDGDIETLWDHLPTEKPKGDILSPNFHRYQRYKEILIDIIKNDPKTLSRDELFVIYDWCIGNMPQQPNKFTAILKHHHIHCTSVNRGGRTVRGIRTHWRMNTKWRTQALKEIAADVI
jgi:hypothetical protein